MLPVFIQAGSVAGPIGIAIMTAAFVGQMVWQNAKHIHEGEDDVKKALVLLGYRPGHAHILSRRGKYGSGEASGKGQMQALMNYASSKGMNADDLRAWIKTLTREQVVRLSEAVFDGIGIGNGNLLYGPEDGKKLPAYIIPPGTLVGSASFRRRMAKDFEADLVRADVPLPYSGGAVI
jgi:hypothetical protein